MYRWVEHTSELELEIEAASEAAVFEEALAAFAELVADGPVRGAEQREVEVSGDDRGSLLVAWLNELAFLAETQGFVPERATELDLADRLRAAVSGHRGEPPHLVEAVTLHQLLFAPDGDGWRARVVPDV